MKKLKFTALTITAMSILAATSCKKDSSSNNANVTPGFKALSKAADPDPILGTNAKHLNESTYDCDGDKGNCIPGPIVTAPCPKANLDPGVVREVFVQGDPVRIKWLFSLPEYISQLDPMVREDDNFMRLMCSGSAYTFVMPVKEKNVVFIGNTPDVNNKNYLYVIPLDK